MSTKELKTNTTSSSTNSTIKNSSSLIKKNKNENLYISPSRSVFDVDALIEKLLTESPNTGLLDHPLSLPSITDGKHILEPIEQIKQRIFTTGQKLATKLNTGVIDTTNGLSVDIDFIEYSRLRMRLSDAEMLSSSIQNLSERLALIASDLLSALLTLARKNLLFSNGKVDRSPGSPRASLSGNTASNTLHHQLSTVPKAIHCLKVAIEQIPKLSRTLVLYGGASIQLRVISPEIMDTLVMLSRLLQRASSSNSSNSENRLGNSFSSRDSDNAKDLAARLIGSGSRRPDYTVLQFPREDSKDVPYSMRAATAHAAYATAVRVLQDVANATDETLTRINGDGENILKHTYSLSALSPNAVAKDNTIDHASSSPQTEKKDFIEKIEHTTEKKMSSPLASEVSLSKKSTTSPSLQKNSDKNIHDVPKASDSLVATQDLMSAIGELSTAVASLLIDNSNKNEEISSPFTNKIDSSNGKTTEKLSNLSNSLAHVTSAFLNRIDSMSPTSGVQSILKEARKSATLVSAAAIAAAASTAAVKSKVESISSYKNEEASATSNSNNSPSAANQNEKNIASPRKTVTSMFPIVPPRRSIPTLSDDNLEISPSASSQGKKQSSSPKIMQNSRNFITEVITSPTMKTTLGNASTDIRESSKNTLVTPNIPFSDDNDPDVPLSPTGQTASARMEARQIVAALSDFARGGRRGSLQLISGSKNRTNSIDSSISPRSFSAHRSRVQVIKSGSKVHMQSNSLSKNDKSSSSLVSKSPKNSSPLNIKTSFLPDIPDGSTGMEASSFISALQAFADGNFDAISLPEMPGHHIRRMATSPPAATDPQSFTDSVIAAVSKAKVDNSFKRVSPNNKEGALFAGYATVKSRDGLSIGLDKLSTDAPDVFLQKIDKVSPLPMHHLNPDSKIKTATSSEKVSKKIDAETSFDAGPVHVDRPLRQALRAINTVILGPGRSSPSQPHSNIQKSSISLIATPLEKSSTIAYQSVPISRVDLLPPLPASGATSCANSVNGDYDSLDESSNVRLRPQKEVSSWKLNDISKKSKVSHTSIGNSPKSMWEWENESATQKIGKSHAAPELPIATSLVETALANANAVPLDSITKDETLLSLANAMRDGNEIAVAKLAQSILLDTFDNNEIENKDIHDDYRSSLSDIDTGVPLRETPLPSELAHFTSNEDVAFKLPVSPTTTSSYHSSAVSLSVSPPLDL